MSDQDFSELIASLGNLPAPPVKGTIGNFDQVLERLRHQYEKHKIWSWIQRMADDIRNDADPTLILIDAYRGPLRAGVKGKMRSGYFIKLVRASKPVLMLIATKEGQNWLKRRGHTVIDWLLTL